MPGPNRSPDWYAWNLHEQWGKPLTDLRAWLWEQAQALATKPVDPVRPLWDPNRPTTTGRFDVAAYLAARDSYGKSDYDEQADVGLKMLAACEKRDCGTGIHAIAV
jgi:hypothetical protein